MSGHSKWANIKHKKASVDAKRGAVFTKVVKLIHAAVRQGGNGDPDMNAALRLAVEKASSVNMPKDNIERAIKKALGDGGTIHYETLTYEGYALGGVAILAEALTDNRNRTTPEVRKIFEKNSGNMGEMGCVAWMFKRAGMIQFDAGTKTEEDLMELAMEVGADDVELSDDGSATLKTEVEVFAKVLDALKAQGFEAKGELVSLPETPVIVDNVETAEKILKLMELIEDHDDVQSVTSNMEMSDEVRAALDV
jgi:YebC/PmpR family DNA-binding regulatory protein